MGVIGILGCGWLGLPLAKRLISEGYLAKGSTTKNDKISTLKQEGIMPYLFSLSTEIRTQKLDDFLKDIEVLIIDTPPLSKRKEEVPLYYRSILQAIKHSGVQKLLLTSSTAVFEETSDFPIYTELSKINPTNVRSENLYAIERYFSDIQEIKTTIVRLGGLYGDNRHPADYLGGRTDVKNPYAPVNLTSQEMAIEGIVRIIKENKFKKVFHLLEKEHPAKIFYYTQKCKERGVIPPKFQKGKSIGKIVTSFYM